MYALSNVDIYIQLNAWICFEYIKKQACFSFIHSLCPMLITPDKYLRQLNNDHMRCELSVVYTKFSERHSSSVGLGGSHAGTVPDAGSGILECQGWERMGCGLMRVSGGMGREGEGQGVRLQQGSVCQWSYCDVSTAVYTEVRWNHDA